MMAAMGSNWVSLNCEWYGPTEGSEPVTEIERMFRTCRRSRQVLVSAVLVWGLMAGPGEAESHIQGTETTAQRPTLGPVEISEGVVILDGAYVRPPYTVQWTWPAALVNWR
jgi:hypothetical protein